MAEDNVELTPPVFLTFADGVVRVDRTFTGSWYLVKEERLHAEAEPQTVPSDGRAGRLPDLPAGGRSPYP